MNEKKPPNVLKKAANIVSAVVQHVATGMENVPDSIVKERFAICLTCPEYLPVSENEGRCLACGCILKNVIDGQNEGLNKLRWADQKCPLNKWLEYKDKKNEGV